MFYCLIKVNIERQGDRGGATKTGNNSSSGIRHYNGRNATNSGRSLGWETLVPKAPPSFYLFFRGGVTPIVHELVCIIILYVELKLLH